MTVHALTGLVLNLLFSTGYSWRDQDLQFLPHIEKTTKLGEENRATTKN